MNSNCSKAKDAVCRILCVLIFICLLPRGDAAQKPNFLIVYVDDLGWADTSVRMMKGDPESASDFHQTPHLEQLARRGMVFSNAYAPAPTCTPSRKSIQFGKTPGRLQYTFVHDVLALERKLKWQDELSLADVVKAADASYVTAHFGKGMGGEQMKTIGYDVTDEIDGKADNGNFHGDFVSLRNRVPLPADNPKRMASLRKSSVDFLKQHSGKRPFLMMVSHYAVHVPHAARPDLIEKYRRLPRGKHCQDEDYLPTELIPEGRKISHWRLQYAAMLEELDEGLGAMVVELRKTGQLDNTLIIFTSDNGGLSTSEGSPTSNLPLRGGKGWLYEGGIREPYLIKWPSMHHPGSTSSYPVSSVDFYPTLLELAGLPLKPDQHLDGVSLVPLLEGKTLPSRSMFWHYPHYSNQGGFPGGAIRSGPWKAIERYEDGTVHLYHLLDDPGETHDLSSQHPEKLASLRSELHRWYREVDAAFLQAKPNGPKAWRP